MKKEEQVAAFLDAVERVNARTAYGVREVDVPKRTYFILNWSNGGAIWDVFWKVSGTIKLDANQIIVRADSEKQANEIAKELPDLPLYKASHEAKQRGIYDASIHVKAIMDRV